MDSGTGNARMDGVTAFGADLRREREDRGMAMEAICDATKVSPKYIRALESGAVNELPGGVFRRGFVRSYVRTLGLDDGPWVARFEASCRASGVVDPLSMEWATFAENVKNGRAVTRRRMGLRWAGVMGMGAALAVAGWCGWRLATHRNVLPKVLIWVRMKSWVDKANSR